MRQLFSLMLLVCFFAVSSIAQTNHKDHSWDSNSKAFLGIESDDISLSKANTLGFKNPHGVMVERVVKNSSADDAGLQPFDYLYKIGDKDFSSNYGLTEALREHKAGDKTVLTFIRKGKSYTNNVTLGSYDDRDHRYTTDRSRKAFLGVSPAGERSREFQGVRVNITDGSTAEKVGMQNGDILTYIDDYRILEWGDITMALRNIEPEQEISVVYIQNGLERRGTSVITSRRNHSYGHNDGDGDFEERMERFGEKMERLGERIEEKAERFGARVENWADENGDDIEEIADEIGEEIEDAVEGIFGSNDNRRDDDWSSHHNKAFIGIYSNSVSASKARFMGLDNRYGSLVTGTIGNTAAANAGLEIFDYIYGIDQYRTGGDQSLGTILHKFSAGDEAELVFIRRGKKMTKQVKFIDKSEAQYNKKDECDEPFLGISKSSDSDKGRVIVNPVQNSTAMAMGIQKGDAILKINNYPIYDWHDVSTVIDAMNAGQTIKVDIDRNGKKVSLSDKVKARREVKDCDDDEEDYEMREQINEDEDFNFDWDDEEVIVARGSTGSAIDISDMEVEIQDMPSEDSDNMKNKYGLDMPVVSNLDVSQVNVFPNPSIGMFMLKFDLAQRGDTSIRIFNNLGREIYNYELSDFSGTFEDNIDISQNGAGSYYLAVTQNGKTMTKKIILQRR